MADTDLTQDENDFVYRRKEILYSLRSSLRNPLTIGGFVIVGGLIVAAIFAPFIAPYNSLQISGQILAAPDKQHLFGTDNVGRDIFSRVINGTRIDLQIAIIVVSIAAVLGTGIGLFSGTVGGLLDGFLMRIADIFLGFPSFVLAIALAAALGRGIYSAEIALSVSLFPWYARLVRSQVLRVKEMEFIEASKSLGSSKFGIIRRHILPNVSIPIIINASLDVAKAILLAAALGFLGIGAQEPSPEWGLMMAEGQTYMFSAWWIITFPGIAIMIAVLGFNLLGDGLQDLLDPMQRRRGPKRT